MGMKPILHKIKQVAVQVVHGFIFVHLPLANLLVYVIYCNSYALKRLLEPVAG